MRIVVSEGSWGSPWVLALLLCMASIPCSRIVAICSSPCSIEPGWLLFSWVVVGESGIHQQNVSAGPDVTWFPLVPLNLLVHHPAPRSSRFTRTLGPRSWSTLPSPHMSLVHPSLLLALPDPR